jgi:hypothetical protein
MTQTEITIASCLASEASWRQEAANLRAHAIGSHYLGDEQRAALLRQSDAANRQADWWRDAVIAARIAAIAARATAE